jgi:hypothetical protein
MLGWRACDLNRAGGVHHRNFLAQACRTSTDASIASRPAICYGASMTRQGLELLLERVSAWPEEAQEEFVKSVADIETKHFGVYRLSDEERDAVRRGLADMREGKLATDEAVAAVFNRYRG